MIKLAHPPKNLAFPSLQSLFSDLKPPHLLLFLMPLILFSQKQIRDLGPPPPQVWLPCELTLLCAIFIASVIGILHWEQSRALSVMFKCDLTKPVLTVSQYPKFSSLDPRSEDNSLLLHASQPPTASQAPICQFSLLPKDCLLQTEDPTYLHTCVWAHSAWAQLMLEMCIFHANTHILSLTHFQHFSV